MATLLLSAAGAALGANLGGAVLGLSGLVIGRAVGATLGRLIDQRLLGLGSGPVETGRIERLQVTGAGEGVPMPRVWGRMRTAGHVIWASRFEEIPGKSRRSKGGLGPKVKDASHYVVSVAIALCEGEITGIGRIWAYGDEIARSDLNLRVYPGSVDQLPDPKIAAVEGEAPAYRGTAYVVIEDLDLSPWGNRLPNLAFEVIRAAEADGVTTLQDAVLGVAWLPGAGEYALAAEAVRLSGNAGDDPFASGFSVAAKDEERWANRNSPSGAADFATALTALEAELPAAKSSLLIAAWFGDDLRCGHCRVRPKVEPGGQDGREQPWQVAGLTRGTAGTVAENDGQPVYGGTPGDSTILQAIAAMNAAGHKVTFYPFLLMEQLAGNGLPDPWTGADDQPALPWRGRITLSVAPGQPGTPDRSADAADEVAAFFGTAAASDFVVSPGQVSYAGPDEWSYRRFILHYAALCAASDGVDAFCIGSEMRALLQIRGAGDSFPAVAQMIDLLHEVRALLGPSVTLTYAADWSEYWGHDAGEGNRYFHLDPLWSDDELNVIGIDNYMPLADWREGEAHADWLAGWRDIHDPAYLRANIAGGEGFDWYYDSPQHRDVQLRTPITDSGESEPWVWRFKDLRAWWENAHNERLAGVKQADSTDWVPRSKPVWFTEYGCAAIDKGANQPNVFIDPKSSESQAPHYSTGARDDLMQMQYLLAMHAHWTDPATNPASDVYDGRMVDWSRSHAWAWDARPFPWFPALTDLWSDGGNWPRGHWLTGRAAAQPLAAVVAEICQRAGVAAYDVSGLYGVVRGYAVASTVNGRAALQPLMLAHGFEAVERDGVLVFRMRHGRDPVTLDPARLVAREGGDLELARASAPETAGRLRLTYVEAEGGFETRSAEAVHPGDPSGAVGETEMPMALTRGEARSAVKRWLAEARVARDVAKFGLPMSSPLAVGDVVSLGEGSRAALYRIDRMELAGERAVEAVRIEPGLYRHRDGAVDLPVAGAFVAPVPVLPLFLDLPLIRGDEVEHAPHLAVSGTPWPGSVAAYDAPAEGGSFALNTRVGQRATIGETRTPLFEAAPGLLQRGAGVEVVFPVGAALASVGEGEWLDGANLAAIGTGSGWEIVQYQGATLVEPGVWRLTDLLRGQFGTEPLIPDAWAPGAVVVLLDGAPVQVDLPASARGVARRWRIGPAALAHDDPVFVAGTEAFAGIGLRPWAPVFLRTERPAGDLLIRWTRRTRKGGDGWDAPEVPLSEEAELYRLRIRHAGAVVREVELDAPSHVYTAAAQASDGVSGAFVVEVAQVSASFGPGLWAAVPVEG